MRPWFTQEKRRWIICHCNVSCNSLEIKLSSTTCACRHTHTHTQHTYVLVSEKLLKTLWALNVKFRLSNRMWTASLHHVKFTFVVKNQKQRFEYLKEKTIVSWNTTHFLLPVTVHCRHQQTALHTAFISLHVKLVLNKNIYIQLHIHGNRIHNWKTTLHAVNL